MNNLFHQFAAGSESAFNSYYKRWHGSIYTVLKRLCGDEALAQDLTQEVFKNLWDRRDSIKDEDHLRNYLFRMSRCVFLMYDRRRRKMLSAENAVRWATEPADEDRELIVVQEQVFATVKDALMKLPPQQKMVMELLMLQGLDVRSVANRLQLAAQTVRNHKSQALLFLRKELYGRDLSLAGLLIIPLLILHLI
jgi:RNA polymerase sigma-70 factor (ECF subfamily)